MRQQVFHACDCACACAAPAPLPAQVPAQSDTEKLLEKQQYDYGQKLMPSVDKLVALGDAGLKDQVSVNYNDLWSKANPAIQRLQGTFENMLNEYNQGTKNLSQGIVDPSFANARKAAMSTGIEDTVGKKMQQLYRKGLVGGTDMRNMQDSVNQTVAQKMNEGFTEDVKTSQGLLDSRMSGLGNLVDNATTQAMTPIKAATQAQESALNAPMKYYGAATGQIQPSNALYGTLSDQRYSVASPNQWYTPPTITSGCFPAGTQVNTPDGMKNIETIQVGDTVSTADDGDTMVIAVMEPRQEMVIILATNKGNIVCSNSQPFFDEDYEEITAHNIKVGESIMHVSGMVKITSKLYVHLSPKTVYNFTTQTGDYLVNGFVASDWGGQ